MVLFSSSSPKGICYVETKSLDGETNLKHKQAHSNVYDLIQSDDAFKSLKGKMLCGKPNDQIYVFDGLLAMKTDTKTRIKASIYYENFLLRGSSLKNTDWITGLVCHTGHETRIMMNSTGSKAKSSRIEKLMNVMILYIFLLQIFLCTIAACWGTIWELVYANSATYLDLTKSTNSLFVKFATRFGTWILIFTNIVPISLIVTLEMVKYLQALFITWDYQNYDPSKDMPTTVQSSNLNEELGQISHIFSDKTGTLTCNIMDFKKFSAGKYSYGQMKGGDAP